MKNLDKIIKSAMTGILALTTVGALVASTNVSAAENNKEKCYGIVKAGMNDCETSTASCAGSATKDNQPDAYLFVPTGTCHKIVGGSLTPKDGSKPKAK